MLRGLILALLFAGACSSGHGDVSLAASRAEPHVEAFADFERWALRARLAAGAEARESMAETSFAPLRLDPSVLAAWIEMEGGHPSLLTMPAGAEPPPSGSWVSLRDGDQVLSVHGEEPCTVQVPSWWRSPPAAGCVLLSRRTRAGPGQHVTVTVAFRAPRAEGEATASASR